MEVISSGVQGVEVYRKLHRLEHICHAIQTSSPDISLPFRTLRTPIFVPCLSKVFNLPNLK